MIDKKVQIENYFKRLDTFTNLQKLLKKLHEMTSQEGIIEFIERTESNEISQAMINSFLNEQDIDEADRLFDLISSWKEEYLHRYVPMRDKGEDAENIPYSEANIDAESKNLEIASFNEYKNHLEIYHRHKLGDLKPFIFEESFVLDKERLGKKQQIYMWNELNYVTVRYDHDEYFEKNSHIFTDEDIIILGIKQGELLGHPTYKFYADEIPYNFKGNFVAIKYDDIWDALIKSNEEPKSMHPLIADKYKSDSENNSKRFKDLEGNNPMDSK